MLYYGQWFIPPAVLNASRVRVHEYNGVFYCCRINYYHNALGASLWPPSYYWTFNWYGTWRPAGCGEKNSSWGASDRRVSKTLITSSNRFFIVGIFCFRHNDLPWNIRKFLKNQLRDFQFSDDLRDVSPWSHSSWSHTDLRRLREGMVAAQVRLVT